MKSFKRNQKFFKPKGKYHSAHQGWIKLIYPEKYVKPLDEYMESTSKMLDKDGNCIQMVQYKSRLERQMIEYCDANKFITRWSEEPFAIPYIKPTDGKYHRYYIDFMLEFSSGDKFLVEIKSFEETQKPDIPKHKTTKAMFNYQEALQTYLINLSKWKTAKKFAEDRGLKFIILTEKELF